MLDKNSNWDNTNDTKADRGESYCLIRKPLKPALKNVCEFMLKKG
jgi:hypothetical protein